jgi:hypothetical protein
MSDASSPEKIAEIANVPGLKVYHEYKAIWSVEVRGKDVSEKKVGYLDKQFTEEDPEGKFFVRDLAHDVRGFLLPEGKAFVYVPRLSDPASSRDLGNTGFENGVKKILGASGEVQFRPLDHASTAPPPD